MRNGQPTKPQLTLSTVGIVTPLQSGQLAKSMLGVTIATMNLGSRIHKFRLHNH